MKGKVWKRIRGRGNKNWGKKTSFSNVIPQFVINLVSVKKRRRELGIRYSEESNIKSYALQKDRLMQTRSYKISFATGNTFFFVLHCLLTVQCVYVS